MNIKAGILATLTALASVIPVAPAKATGSFDEHKYLFATIHSHGVRVIINDFKECSKGIDGSYWSRERVLHVCQDNARPGGDEIDWTANDLDTLRHEAHHMVQDCHANGLGDRYILPLFGSRSEVLRFVEATIGTERAQRIMDNPAYRDRPNVHLTEMEAFATAYAISPSKIAEKLNELCR